MPTVRMPTIPSRPRLIGATCSVLLTITFITACGSGDDDNSSAATDAADSLLPAAEGTTEYPLTLSTWAGESILEERPERIAVVGFSPNYDALESLDAVPVYALSDEVEREYNDPEFRDMIEFVDPATRRDPLNMENIADADPDLIIATNFIEEAADYHRLSAIAPVLENAEQVVGDQISWQDTQRMVGEALDLSSAANQAITAAEARIDAVADAHPEWEGRTFTIATDYADYPMEYYTVTDGTAEQFVTRLGFSPNPLAEDFVENAEVADEQVGRLDADVLVVVHVDQESRERRESQSLFQDLAPVTDGHYVAVVSEEEGSGGDAVWVLRRGASALSLPWAAEVIADNWLAEIELD